MSQIEHFDKLLQDARRDDGYINATKWCKHFGYDLRNWKRLPETKARLTELSERLKISESNSEVDRLRITDSVVQDSAYTDNTECVKITHSVVQDSAYTDNTECVKITHSVSQQSDNTTNTESVKITYSVSKELIYTSGRGYSAVTWIHPIMAVHLASYLDPAFANYVAEIFVRYVAADPKLAADIALRQETTEGLDIINKAVQERYEFLNSKLMRAYYMVRDAWGDKLHYNTLTEEIQLNGSPLELKTLRIKLEQELHVKVAHEDARLIIKTLAIVNTYPLMAQADQQRFFPAFRTFIERRSFVPAKESPRPQKSS
ncbi:KilA-N domain-containing protein [Nostoc sp. CCY 9925]|uniref:KilA-N domain-containing protein n=1 Tax=Nostoc sp. CCY 9925 TaxID=3103865 RepID=UPI0039C5E2EB